MKRWGWTMALAAAMACATASAAVPEGQDEVATRVVTHAGDHRLIVLGELHGTRETPLLVQALMEIYAAIHGSREQRSPPTLTGLIGDLPLYNVRIEARGGEFWGCQGRSRLQAAAVDHLRRSTARALNRP
jgi:hypothetical protein